jgi:hypothetical protein
MSGKIRNRYNADGTLRTADQWRAMAVESNKRSAESFERCDTDGFLSQWASDTVAREYRAWADLAAENYQAEFPAIFDLDGKLMDARQVETRYGWAWAISLPGGGTAWFNESGARKGATRYRNDTGKGYRLGTVSREAYVVLEGSNATSVGPCVRPVRDSAVTVVDDGTGMTQYADWN